jgi:SAM-dependent methyltransferase
LPRPCRRALAVGCGVGHFARQLAARTVEVDAIDRSSAVLTRARALHAGVGNLRFVDADFLEHPLPPSSYDFVSALAALHHLPFAAAVEKMKDALRPGGVLGIIGLHREPLVVEYLAGVVAWPLSRYYRLTRGALEVSAPVAAPSMTLGEIRRAAAASLPGAVVRRGLFWRYSLVWTKPRV